MISIEMFKGTMGLPTQMFTKFFTSKGRVDTDERQLWIAAAADPRGEGVHKIFLPKYLF